MQKATYEFISKQMNDPILERRTCPRTGEEFAIFQGDKDFYKNCLPTINGTKPTIPFPTLSPMARQARRMAFRNERNLYHRKCDLTGKEIISVYAADNPYKIYDEKVRWSDQRDPMSYAITFNPQKSFFQQFSELKKQVPLMSIMTNNQENCMYSLFNDFKNSYMCVSGMGSEDCMYCFFVSYSHKCIDCNNLIKAQHCYECVDCNNVYKCLYCQDCNDSSNLSYCHTCVNCEFCIGCANLVNKRYCIDNKEYSKEEYFKLANEVKNRQIAKPKFLQNYHGFSNENCFGDYIKNSKNCKFVFDVNECEDCAYIHNSPQSLKHTYDSSYAVDGESNYECLSPVGGVKEFCTEYCRYSNHVWYSAYCFNCAHVFGCIGLRNKQYCIFNKQYTPAEYEQEIGKIITYMTKTGERGNFFPPALSPFGYNETIAADLMPLSKSDAIALGFNRYDGAQQKKEYNAKYVDEVSSQELANEEFVLQQIFTCRVSGKFYRLTKKELQMYKELGVGLPALHPEERYKLRSQKRTGKQLYVIPNNQGEQMLSVYPAQSATEIVDEKTFISRMFG